MSKRLANLARCLMLIAIGLIAVSLLLVPFKGASVLLLMWGDGRFLVIGFLGLASLTLALLSSAIRQQEVGAQDSQECQDANLGYVSTCGLGTRKTYEHANPSDVEHSQCNPNPRPRRHARILAWLKRLVNHNA